MEQDKIRNIAIIAHVDHGKTTLVDGLFKFAGSFRDNQKVDERLMDSNDLEKERGITITSKNGAFNYKDHTINIIDTPGHADFGGQVERVLKMADGALLLVDAQEGPMPQTYFVLKKALALSLPIIVVINKIDKPAARPYWAVDQVFDLFVKLGAPDNLLDFPVVYASAREGFAIDNLEDPHVDMAPLCDRIISYIPAPTGDPNGPLQVLGHLDINKEIAVAMRDGSLKPARITKVFRFEVNQKVPTEHADCGEIVAISGMDEVTVGCTYTDPLNPIPLPPSEIDPPTISMGFIPNDSPFAGREGQFVTSRHLAERLARETMADVALQVVPNEEGMGFQVSGRGELHLSILIEKMRREGYEFQVTRPQVILKEVDGVTMEPIEELTIDVAEEYMGTVMEKLGTRGLGVMNYVFHGYDTYAGEIKYRTRGAMVSMCTCKTVAFALFNLQERGKLFVEPVVDVYEGQIVGEHCREGDLIVNPAKGKKLTNMRAAGSDENVILTPMSLEDCISYINEDELVEVTPKAIRLRKRHMRKWYGANAY